jgi:GNAT superfamily N-acetyltransferase
MDHELIRRIEERIGKFTDGWATDIIHTPEAEIYINSELPHDRFLNYACGVTSPANIPAFVRQVEDVFCRYGATPSFVIAPYTSEKLKNYLLENNYRLSAKNAWMFFDPASKLPKPKADSLELRRIENQAEFENFAQVMVEVFSKGEPDDPYQGFSPQWGKILLKQFQERNPDYLLETYLAYLSGELAGGAQLLYADGVAFLDWLSVLPRFRRRGVGSALQQIRANEAERLGAEHICLITEAGSRNERIFTKSGFKTEFVSFDLTKDGE